MYTLTPSASQVLEKVRERDVDMPWRLLRTPALLDAVQAWLQSQT